MNCKLYFVAHPKTVLAAAIALLLAIGANGQSVPSLVNYQGRLTDQAGNPLSAGAYTLQFNLWDSQTLTNSADLIWNQQQAVAVQSNGLFNVILGAAGGTSPIPGTTPAVNSLAAAFAGANRYLGLTVTVSNGITITSPSEILPRQQLLTVPYAVVATTAANATAAVNATTAANGVPAGTILPYAGSDRPSGYLMCDGRQQRTNDYPALFAKILYTYGGSGSGFNVPNLNGYFPVGRDTHQTEFYQLSQTGGVKTASVPAHQHTVPHLHWPHSDGTSSGDFDEGHIVTFSASEHDAYATGDASTGSGGAATLTTLPPYIVVNYIIKY